MQLQTLPAPLATVESKPILMDDNTAVVTVGSWAISTVLFDGRGGVRGPVPVLASEQPEQTLGMVSDDPAAFLFQYAVLTKR